MNDHSLGLILSCYAIYEKPYSDEIQSVLNQVSSYFGKHVSYLFVKDRKPQRIYMRQLAILIMTRRGISRYEIGNVFEIDTDTVGHHFKVIKGLLDVDLEARADFIKITA